MSWFVWAPEMPLAVCYPEVDSPMDIAEFYERMIETKRTWPYFLGPDSWDGSVVVNYGLLPGVTVSEQLPEGWAKPIWSSTLGEDTDDTDIWHDVRFSHIDDPDWMFWPQPWRSLAGRVVQLTSYLRRA